MTKRLRAPAALKVSVLFFKVMKDLAKSTITASRQMNKFNKLLKQWEKETKNDERKKTRQRHSSRSGNLTTAKKESGRFIPALCAAVRSAFRHRKKISSGSTLRNEISK